MQFRVSIPDITPAVTKREVLSLIARLYDPIGLLGPVVSKAKIFLQRLWLLKLSWNDPLPAQIVQEWRCFISTLKCIEDIHLDRCMLQSSTGQVTLLGFADASSVACGAVVYIQQAGETPTCC